MNAIFTGRKRSGKTTLAWDMAMRAGGGIIIYDPKREWRGWPSTVNDIAGLEAAIKSNHEVIVFHPVGDKREEGEKLFDFVCKLHQIAMEKNWDKVGAHFTLLVDEAVNVSTAKWVAPKLLSLVAENRPEILDIFLTFQSPKDVNNLLKSRMDTWYIFNTSLPSDLEYLNKEVGVPEQDLEEIKNLREHEYAHFTFDGGTPKVDYNYSPEEWFRPMEYFELNSREREEIMAKDENDDYTLSELFEAFLDFMEDKKKNREPRERGERQPRERGEREPRERRSEKKYTLW